MGPFLLTLAAFSRIFRTQTAEAFIADLLANEGSNTAVYTAPSKRSAPDAQRVEEERHRAEMRLRNCLTASAERTG